LLGEIRADGLEFVMDPDFNVLYKVFHGKLVSFFAYNLVEPLDDFTDGLELFGVVFVFGIVILQMITDDLEKIVKLCLTWNLLDITHHHFVVLS